MMYQYRIILVTVAMEEQSIHSLATAVSF